MSIVFDYLVKLYKQSKQYEINNKDKMNYNPLFKSRYFMQLILYTFDEAYFMETEARKIIKIRNSEISEVESNCANDMEHKYKILFECFPYISEQRCETFIKIFREIQMDKIIDKFTTTNYDLSFLSEGNIRERLLERLQFNDFYPDAFIEYLDKNKYDKFPFGLTTKKNPISIDFVHQWDNVISNQAVSSIANLTTSQVADPIPRTDSVSITSYMDMRNDNFVCKDLNEIIDRIDDKRPFMGRRLDMLLSNLVFVPNKVKASSTLIYLIADYYKKEYNNFLIDYFRKNKNIVITSIDEQCNPLIKIIMDILKGDK